MFEYNFPLPIRTVLGVEGEQDTWIISCGRKRDDEGWWFKHDPDGCSFLFRNREMNSIQHRDFTFVKKEKYLAEEEKRGSHTTATHYVNIFGKNTQKYLAPKHAKESSNFWVIPCWSDSGLSSHYNEMLKILHNITPTSLFVANIVTNEHKFLDFEVPLRYNHISPSGETILLYQFEKLLLIDNPVY